MSKYLHVISSMDPKLGGVSQAVRSLIQGANALSSDVHEVLSCDVPDADFAGMDPFVIHLVGPSITASAYSPRMMPWLRSHLLEYDYIFIHGLWQFHSYAVTKIARELKDNGARPKILVMPHGMLDPYFQRDPSRRIKALRNKFYWSFVERNVINRSDAVIFTCEEEKLLARIPFGRYVPNSELVLGLGVDPPPEYNDEMRESFIRKCPSIVGKEYLLFLSRIHPKKGVDILIKSYVDFVNSGKFDDQRGCPDLVIAGPLDSKYAEQMQELALAVINVGPGKEMRSDIQPQIHFVGMLRGNEKWGAFYGCSSFVLPSHQENFGIAVVEALACGKPVLISKNVNIWREIVEDGAGFAGDADVSSYLNLLDEFWSLGSDKINLLGIRSNFCYKKRFGINEVAARLVRLLASLKN